MINLVTQLLATQLNQHLRRTYDLNEDKVIVSNLLEMDGSVASNINNRLVIYLINIEKDAVASRYVTSQETDSRSVQRRTPLNLNLFVMMTAHFTGNNYAEALKFLSNTISYFQSNPVFNHQNTPDMDRRIEKIILDIENLSIQDLSNLWGSLGGKYLPSILYRVRMITLDVDGITGQLPVVTEPRSTVEKN